MREELIQFETAKLAKEKGFVGIKSQANNWYYHDGTLHHETNINGYKGLKGWNTWGATQDVRWDAPTQSLLQRWLREEHSIFVDISTDCMMEPKFCYCHRQYVTGNYEWVDTMKGAIYSDLFYTYELALEAGLKEALTLIKD